MVHWFWYYICLILQLMLSFSSHFSRGRFSCLTETEYKGRSTSSVFKFFANLYFSILDCRKTYGFLCRPTMFLFCSYNQHSTFKINLSRIFRLKENLWVSEQSCNVVFLVTNNQHTTFKIILYRLLKVLHHKGIGKSRSLSKHKPRYFGIFSVHGNLSYSFKGAASHPSQKYIAPRALLHITSSSSLDHRSKASMQTS